MSRTHHLRPPSNRWRVSVEVTRGDTHPQKVTHTVTVRATSEASARLRAVRHLGGAAFSTDFRVVRVEPITSGA